jgi:hypothetical protein
MPLYGSLADLLETVVLDIFGRRLGAGFLCEVDHR